MTQVKSAYSNGAGRSSKAAATNAGGDEERSSTTHYAYVLLEGTDEQGRRAKDFVNTVQIYENEGKFGTYFKMRVTGPVPTGDIFIAKKRPR